MLYKCLSHLILVAPITLSSRTFVRLLKINCWKRDGSICLGSATPPLHDLIQPGMCWDSLGSSGLMQYPRGGFWAYLVVFAHKLEYRNLEMLGKVVLWRVLLHWIIRNTAEESRGREFNGFPRNGKEAKTIPAYLTKERKRGFGSLKLSYHPCYFLFGHRSKFGSDREQQQQLIITSPDKEQLGSGELAGHGPAPSAEGLPESCRPVCPRFTLCATASSEQQKPYAA